MGSYQSSPVNIISGQPFSLSITTFTEYYAYTNYKLTINPIDYTSYSFVSNGDGTSTITFANITIGGTGSYPFVLNGDDTNIIMSGYLDITSVCYLKGTKILCLIDDVEQYVNIENIVPGTLIKTYKNGYKKLKILGWNKFQNNSRNDPDVNKISKLYKLSKNKNSDLIDDLYVSAYHSILVDNLSQSQIDLTKKHCSKLPKINDKYLLMSFISSDFEFVNDNCEYELFHIILENDDDIKQQFGIWANGILSESMSYNTYLRKKRFLCYHKK